MIIARSLLIGLALLALCSAIGSAQAQQADMTFFVSSVGSGKGADLGGLDGADALCARLAQAAGSSGKTWRAYLSTQAVGGAAVNARPHRTRAVAKREGRGHRQGRRGPPRTQQQPDQADRAHREGRSGERPRRQSQYARHPDRLAAGRHGVRRRRGPDLRQLHQERVGRRRDGRPSRPHGIERRPSGEILERVASFAGRLQPGCAEKHRRRGVALLFCGELRLAARAAARAASGPWRHACQHRFRQALFEARTGRMTGFLNRPARP